MKMSYVLLAGLWIIWCVIHSGMIGVTVTDSLKRRLGSYFRFYRLFFNLTAIVTIIPVTLYLIVGTVLEERKLVLELGEDYRRYQMQVSMLFPFKYLTARFRKFAQT
jgi:protein-S-isoprenylcysteine O-methyltransferase Ste14